MYRLIYFCLIAVFAVGCATTPEQRHAYAQREAARLKAAHGETCEKLGYQPETDRWRDCLLELENQRIMQQQMLMDWGYWRYPGYLPYAFHPGCYRSGGRTICY